MRNPKNRGLKGHPPEADASLAVVVKPEPIVGEDPVEMTNGVLSVPIRSATTPGLMTPEDLALGAQLASKVGALETAKAQDEAAIAALQANRANDSAGIAANSTGISGLQGRMGVAEGKIAQEAADHLADVARILTLESSVGAMLNRLTTNDATIAALGLRMGAQEAKAFRGKIGGLVYTQATLSLAANTNLDLTVNLSSAMPDAVYDVEWFAVGVGVSLGTVTYSVVEKAAAYVKVRLRFSSPLAVGANVLVVVRADRYA